MARKRQLQTSRLILRAAVPTDVHALHEFFTDELSMRYWSHPPHTSLLQTSAWLERMSSSPANGTREFLIARLDAPDVVIGKIGLYAKDVGPEMEIGVMVMRSQWGKGYAKEALKAYLWYIWDSERLEEAKEIQTIVADVDPRNEASLKLFFSAGFKVTGYEQDTFKTHIGWCDSYYLKLNRVDWKAS